MTTIANFPFFELEFNKDINLVNPQQVPDVLDGINTLGITDLIIISHGWNNDMDEARSLYLHLLTLLDPKINAIEGKKFGALGILWPSKKFADSDLIPGGAAGINGMGIDDKLIAQVQSLKGFFEDGNADEHLDAIQGAIKQNMETGNLDDNNLFDALKGLFKPIANSAESVQQEEAPVDFEGVPMKELLIRLRDKHAGAPAATGGAGGAAGLGSWFNGVKDGLLNLLNFATYYQMKDRAGKIGMLGVNPVIHKIQAGKPSIRLHLIGHSFGARVVTASIAGSTPGDAVFVNSLILLQAAFSHYGFGKDYNNTPGQNGLFRRVIDNKNIKGVMVVSHSIQDKAVGVAYPLASRLARQVGEGLGGPDDVYGGLGANGALDAGAIVTISISQVVPGNPLPVYTFQKGSIYNLNADITITAHGDIANPAVNEVIAAVIG